MKRSILALLFSLAAVVGGACGATIRAEPVDPLAPLKAENPTAYALVHALLLKSQLGLTMHGTKTDFSGESLLQVGASVVADPLAELKAKDPNAYALVKTLLMKSQLGLLFPNKHHEEGVSLLQTAEDPLAALQAVDPKAYALVKALLLKSQMGVLFSDKKNYASLLQLSGDADPLAPLKAQDPAAYALVKALLVKSQLGMLFSDKGARRGVSLLQKDKAEDPLAPLAKENPQAYALVKALLLKSQMGIAFDKYAKSEQGVALLQTSFSAVPNALEELAPLKETDPNSYNLVARLLVKAGVLDNGVSLMQIDGKPLPESSYRLAKTVLASTKIGALLLQVNDSTKDDPLAALQVVNPKAYAIVQRLLKSADVVPVLQRTAQKEKDTTFQSFIQEQNAHNVDPSETLERLAPVLERLAKLDKKAFGAIQSALTDVSDQGLSLLQTKLSDALSEASTLVSALNRQTYPRGAAVLLQLLHKADGSGESDDLRTEQTLERLAPILEHLRSLDAKRFGALASAASSVGSESFLQVDAMSESESTDPSQQLQTVSKLEDVVEKLRSVDSNSAGILEGLLEAAREQSEASLVRSDSRGPSEADRLEVAAGASKDDYRDSKILFIQTKATKFTEKPLDALDRLAPILEKLAALDPKVAKNLSALVDQAAKDQQ